MNSRRVSGHVKVIERRDGPVFYAKWRDGDGRQTTVRLGPKWTGRGRAPDGFLTPKSAEAALAALLADARRGLLDKPATASGRTWGDAVAEWLRACEVKGCAPSTTRDYRSLASARLEPDLGIDTPLEAITTRTVDDYRERLLADEDLSRRTAQKALVAVHSILARAVKRGWIGSNPAASAERIQVKVSGSFNVLEPAQVAALARVAESDADAALYTFAAYSGLRLGELRALRWRDVSFADAVIRVEWNLPEGGAAKPKRPKSEKVRSVPLIDQAATALDGLSQRGWRTGPDDLAFGDEHGVPLDGRALRDRFYAALTSADLGWMRERQDPITFHDLRHTFGTLAVRVWSVVDVQAYMGHADIKTTMRYLHHVPRTAAAGELSRVIADALSADLGTQDGDTARASDDQAAVIPPQNR